MFRVLFSALFPLTASLLFLLPLSSLAKSTDDATPAKWPFERYQVIVDRKVFGDVPAPVPLPPPPPPPPPNPNESFIRDFRMCAITESPEGLRVGLVRVRKQTPRPGAPPEETPEASFFLKIGESYDGVKLVSANYEKEEAVLEKNGDVQGIGMKGPTGPQAAGAAAALMPAAMSAATPSVAPVSVPRIPSPAQMAAAGSFARPAPIGRQPRPTPSAVPRPSASSSPSMHIGVPMSFTPAPAAELSTGNPAAMSYADRLKLRREMRAKRNEEIMAAATNPARPSPEELEKQLREYNMGLIRSGGEAGPPLPIPLTPEEDAQLVDEGVLPPQP